MSYDINLVGTVMYLRELDRQAARNRRLPSEIPQRTDGSSWSRACTVILSICRRISPASLRRTGSIARRAY